MEAYLIDGIRTPVGSFGGSLSGFSAVELGTFVVQELLRRNSLGGGEIDEVILGSVLQAGCGQNIARQVAIRSGVPQEKTALTINMVCGSGLRAVVLAAQAIKAGDAGLIIAGGSESMSSAPYLVPKARFGYTMGNAEMIDSMVHDGLWDAFHDYHMGITAENLAERYKVSRQSQDEFALKSQHKAEAAIKSGRFDDEVIAIEIPRKKRDPHIFKQDEHVRFGLTPEALARLKPAFKKGGTVTAGNASGINDGAAALLVAGEEATRKYGLKPLARIVSYGYAGVDPQIMGLGPVEAVGMALTRGGWKTRELEVIEANEAFAVQSLVLMKELDLNPEITNVNGGAIALGHPIGASGARILVTLIYELSKRHSQKGLASLCIGGGMGIAMCVEGLSAAFSGR